jgi:hypothetical protein
MTFKPLNNTWHSLNSGNVSNKILRRWLLLYNGQAPPLPPYLVAHRHHPAAVPQLWQQVVVPVGAVNDSACQDMEL